MDEMYAYTIAGIISHTIALAPFILISGFVTGLFGRAWHVALISGIVAACFAATAVFGKPTDGFIWLFGAGCFVLGAGVGLIGSFPALVVREQKRISEERRAFTEARPDDIG
jgi:hypothetical protein